MVKLLAVCLTRPLHVVADAAYHGRALRHLPEAITLTTRLPASAVLFDLAPPPTRKRGRPRLKGARLGTPAELAATATFTTTRVARYGRTDQVRIAEVRCLWYGSFHTQTVRIILIRDQDTTTGYGLALVTTDLATPAAALITRYAWRWSIETTFAEAAPCSASDRPATAPRTRSAAPSRSACTATRSPSSGTRCTAIIPATPPTTAHGPPGTPPRPTRPSPTCSPSSAA